MKKLLSVLSSTLQGGLRGGLLFLALLTASSLWAQRFQVGDLYYNITSDTVPYTVEVTYQYKESDINYSGFAEIIIPSSITYNNITYNVTRIGDYAFYKCSSLASITIPNSVTSIGGVTFYDCKSLTFTIPDGVTSIGGSAFSGCSSITSISIPESVTSIGVSAFEGTGYYNDKSNWENGNVLYIDNCLIEANYSLSGEYTIKDSTRLLAVGAFIGCYKLTSITIPESVTSIGGSAFERCTSLTSVVWNAINCEDFNKDKKPFNLTNITSFTFGDNVEHIPAYLCRNMGNLLSITIPNSVTSIGKGAFYNCSSLASVTIGNSVTSIGDYAFYNCSSLASVIIGNSVTSIGENAFSGCSFLASVIIGNSVTTIGDYAFYDCSSLASITIPNSVTSIGKGAFYNCSSLASITIPNSVTSIGDYAFYNCSALTSITLTAPTMETFCHGTTNQQIDLEIYRNIQIDGNEVTEIVIPESVDSIKSKAFYMCNISSVEISDGVTSIGNNAFTDCPSLTSITIPNSVTSIGIGAFSYCTALTSFSVPKSVSKIEEYTFYNCSSLSFIDISNSVTSISPNAFSGCSSLSSVHWNATNYEISRSSYAPFYNILTQITSFTFGDAVDSIPTYLCYGMENLQSLTIGNSVTSIGDYAFNGCSSLTSVTIGNSVTSIGDYAFNNCSALTSVTIPNSVTSIGEYAFSYCSSLTSVTIPNSVTSIGKRAFSYCSSLTSVTIGNSVTSIGDDAFSGCSSLTSVTIGNSVTSIGDYAFNNCSSLSSVHWNAINYDNISSSSDAPFYNIRTQITSFTFGDAVESIPAYLCYGMTNLQSVVIPNSVTSIENYAFSGCSSLTSISIPNSVTSIWYGAFSGCSAISDITITADSMEEYLNGYTNNLCYSLGGALKSAKRHLLIDNEKITDVVIPENIDTINSYAFYNCSDIRSLTLHDNVYLNERPFLGCDSLQSITITAPSIEQYCQSTINDKLYDNGLTNAERNIIIDGQKITDLVIPESVTTISEYLFYNSTSLTSLVLPESVESINKGAFYGCDNLDAIYQTSSTPPTIGTTVFSSFPVCYIPYGSLTAYEKSGWAAQVSKFVEEPLGGYQLFYTSSDGKIITPSVAKAFNAAIINNVYENGQGVITFNGPVSTIKASAFLNNSTLTSITLPAAIMRIEDRAFANCSALGVVEVESTTPPTLGTEAFTSAPTCYIPCGTKHFYEASTWANQVSEFVEEECNGYQIIYTTTDGNTITPSETVDFGAKIISNVYEFGQGIMTFDAPVTHMDGFSNCNTLTSITIPESVTTVGGSCFGNCSSLTSIVWNAKHVEQVKWGGGSWLGAPLPAYDMFEGVRSQITSFVFGESVEYIPDYLCYYMENLREIIIPESVQGISKYAFSRCSALTSAVIGNNVKTIGEHAFSYCSSLTSTTIGKSVITIGEEAFRDCSALTSIVIPDSVLAIENSTFFNCSALTSVTLNNSLISIYDYAFMDCSSLTSITIPENVTYIGSRVFYDCAALTSVTWNAMDCGDFVDYYSDGRKVPSSRFEGCPITSFTFGDNVEYIPGGLCYQMTGLQSIVLPENVYSISDYAFYGCSSLTSITIPEHVYSMGERAFYGCSSLTSITIPENVSSIGGYAFSYCSSLKTVAWNAINPEEIIIEQGSSIVSPFSNSPIESLIIGDRVTYIPQKLCYNCSTLTSVTIGKKVKEIGADAFYGCSALTQTNYTGNIASWCQINFNYMSYPTYYSKNLFINGEEVKDVVIPNTVTSISSCAFYNCEKISSLTIPESVTSIGYNAFAGCKKLFDIYSYPTTPPEAQENSFANYNVNLYVPCDNLRDYQMDIVFGSFKYIQCLEEDTPSVPQDTTIYHPMEQLTICEGETYTWHGYEYSQSGIYIHNEIEETDEYIYHYVYTLELTVQPSETIEYVIEAEDSYEWHGVVYTKSGTYTYEYECTTEILHLTIIDNPSQPQDTTIYYLEQGIICEGDVFEWYSYEFGYYFGSYSDEGTYEYVLIEETEEYIYHHIFTLVLTVEPRQTTIFEVEAEESYEWHGVVYTESGVYTYEEWCHQEILELTIIPSTETAVDNMQTDSDHSAQKILRDGQLYIYHNGSAYTIMGQKVSENF